MYTKVRPASVQQVVKTSCTYVVGQNDCLKPCVYPNVQSEFTQKRKVAFGGIFYNAVCLHISDTYKKIDFLAIFGINEYFIVPGAPNHYFSCCDINKMGKKGTHYNFLYVQVNLLLMSMPNFKRLVQQKNY